MSAFISMATCLGSTDSNRRSCKRNFLSLRPHYSMPSDKISQLETCNFIPAADFLFVFSILLRCTASFPKMLFFGQPPWDNACKHPRCYRTGVPRCSLRSKVEVFKSKRKNIIIKYTFCKFKIIFSFFFDKKIK